MKTCGELQHEPKEWSSLMCVRTPSGSESSESESYELMTSMSPSACCQMACSPSDEGVCVDCSEGGWGCLGVSGMVSERIGSVEVCLCLRNLLSLISSRRARTWSAKSCAGSGPPATGSSWGLWLSWGLSKAVFQWDEPTGEWGLSSWVIDVVVWVLYWEGPSSDINNLSSGSLVMSPRPSEMCRSPVKENLFLPNLNCRSTFVALSNVKVASLLKNCVLSLAMY